MRLILLAALCLLLLVGRVTGEPAVAYRIDREVAASLDPDSRFHLGLEREARDGFPSLRARRVALIASHASYDTRGRHIVEHFTNNPRFTFTRVAFINSGANEPDRGIESLVAASPNLGVFEISPESFKLHESFFQDIEIVVFDAVLPGARYSLETAALAMALEGAALQGVEFLVLDRPLLASANVVDGPTADAPLVGTVEAYFPTPIFPGLTPAELARLYNDYYGLQASLKTVTMSNWTRAEGYAPALVPKRGAEAAGVARLAALSSRAHFLPGGAELAAVAHLVDPGDWTTMSVALVDGRAALRLTPTHRSAGDVWAAVPEESRRGATRIDAPGEALLIAVDSTGSINPVELSIALRVAAKASPEESQPAEVSRGNYGTTFVFEGLAQGASAPVIARAWRQSAAWTNFQEQRRKALLYQP